MLAAGDDESDDDSLVVIDIKDVPAENLSSEGVVEQNGDSRRDSGSSGHESVSCQEMSQASLSCELTGGSCRSSVESKDGPTAVTSSGHGSMSTSVADSRESDGANDSADDSPSACFSADQNRNSDNALPLVNNSQTNTSTPGPTSQAEASNCQNETVEEASTAENEEQHPPTSRDAPDADADGGLVLFRSGPVMTMVPRGDPLLAATRTADGGRQRLGWRPQDGDPQWKVRRTRDRKRGLGPRHRAESPTRKDPVEARDTDTSLIDNFVKSHFEPRVGFGRGRLADDKSEDTLARAVQREIDENSAYSRIGMAEVSSMGYSKWSSNDMTSSSTPSDKRVDPLHATPPPDMLVSRGRGRGHRRGGYTRRPIGGMANFQGPVPDKKTMTGPELLASKFAC